MSVDLEKYRKTPGTTPRVDLSKYRKQPAPFRYDQPNRQERMNQYNEDARLAANEAQSASTGSVGGFMKNFGKSLVSTFVPSPTGLGKSVASIFNPVNKNLAEAQQKGSATSADLVKRIREAKAEGRDTARLERAYNMQADQNQSDTKNIAGELPSFQKVIGQIAGTTLDIIAAGTYGTAKGALAGMQSGKLAPKLSTLPTALQGLRATASKPAGAFTAKGAGRIAGGTALGYGFDVTQGMQGERGQDREGVKALIPGAGTAIGFALPSATEGTQSIKNRFTKDGRTARTIAKRTKVLTRLERDNGPVRRALESADSKEANAREILATTDLLNGAVDRNGTISSKDAISNLRTALAPIEGKVRDTLEQEGKSVALDALKANVDEFVLNSKLKGAAKSRLKSELMADIDGFALSGDSVMMTDLHDTKVFRQNNNNYMDSGANKVSKEAARFFKEYVEKSTESMDVKTYNAELSKFYALEDVLKALQGKKVEGGRLGKHFSAIVGGMIGAQMGGPVGTIIGAEAGAAAKGMRMASALGSKLDKTIKPSGEMLGAMSGRDLFKALTRKEGAQSSKPGNLKNIQSPTTNAVKNPPAANIIPKTVAPTATKSNKMPTEAFGGLAGLEDTDGDGKPDSFSPEAAALGVVGMAASKKVKFHPEDKALMIKFIDFARSKGPALTDKEWGFFEKLAPRLKISLDQPYGKIANQVEDALAGVRNVKGTLLPGQQIRGQNTPK